MRLRVVLTDPATGKPPRGVDLLGWVRRSEPGDAGCVRAAQNFRATQRIPLGSVDLNGLLVATLNRDATLSIVDPQLDLYSSNIVAAHRFGEMPSTMAVDERHMRVLLAWPSGNRIEAARLTGSNREIVADGLPGITALAVSRKGDIWAGDGAGTLHRLAPDGRRLGSVAFGDGIVALREGADDGTDMLGAFTGDGAAAMVESTTGHMVMQFRFTGPLSDVAFLAGTGAFAVLRDRPIGEMRFFDAPERAIEIPLGVQFKRVATGPDGRIALLWSPGKPIFALVDMALGKVVQSIALNEATVSDVAFTENRAFLLSHDGGFIGTIDLAAVALGREALMKRSDLGARSDRPQTTGGPERLLAPLLPRPQVLAVDPERQTAWLAEEIGSSVEKPPMSSIRLRGGVPQAVAVAERRFEEVAPGVFETVWAFPPGAHELVLTTYSGELSTCLPFEVRGEAERLALTPVRLDPVAAPRPVAGRTQQIAFRVIGPEEEPFPLQRLTLRVPSMVSGWSAEVEAQADAEGTLRVEVRLPHPGPYALHPLDLPRPLALKAALIVDAVAPDDTVPTEGDAQ